MFGPGGTLAEKPVPSYAMVRFTLRHDLGCEDVRFWKLFFDRDFSVAMYRALGFPRFEVVDQKETDAGITRVVTGTPKLDVPGPIAKLLGPGFSYREEGRFDRGETAFRFVMMTPLEGKLRTEGVLRCEPRGEKASRRVVELEVEAKLFGLGGMLEGATEKSLRKGWDESAAFINRWAAEHP
jgi:hypothetical protein